MIKKKIYYIDIFMLIVYSIFMIFAGYKIYLLIYLILLAICKYVSICREKELKRMWDLAEENNLTIDTLRDISGLGRLDLQATKYEDSGRYLPPRKVVKQTIQKLEQLSKKDSGIDLF